MGRRYVVEWGISRGGGGRGEEGNGGWGAGRWRGGERVGGGRKECIVGGVEEWGKRGDVCVGGNSQHVWLRVCSLACVRRV